MSREVPPYSSTRFTAELGLILTFMLAGMFASGAFFYLLSLIHISEPTRPH